MAKTAHNYSSKERTSDVLNEDNVNVDFASLLLSSEVLKGLSRAGFERPSPIQLKAIPLGRCGLDLIVQAKSGTGKTCVFGIVILEGLDLQCASVQALVLTPTREIATQVQEVIQSIGSAMQGLWCHTFIGGTLFGSDRQKLKKCHVAVGTPGRIKQLIEYKVLHTDSIRLFVLDEADKLLEDKFQDQINWIYNHLPVNKQMLALSATYPEALARNLTTYMRDPTFVRLNPRHVALKGIKQFYKVVPGHGLYHKAFMIKVEHLLELLSHVSFNQCLVFSNLSSRAQNLSDILCERGWPSTCISGKQDQTERHSAMSMLKAFKCRVLISTDLTARGIDAENVNLIVNLDVPSDGKTYLHRIGRAGRFGSKGVAVTLANEGNEELLLRNIQKHCHVRLRNLPDPLPSDLINISHGTDEIVESDEDPSSEYESDHLDNDKGIKPEESGPRMKTHTSSYVEASGDNSFQESHRDNGYRTGQRSNHRSGVIRDYPASDVDLTDKASQADALNVPFAMSFPVGFKIPSLAEKLCSNEKEDTWSWETVLEGFEKFMGRGSESANDVSHLQTEDSVDEAGDYIKAYHAEDLVGGSTSAVSASLKSDQQSFQTTDEVGADLSLCAARMPQGESKSILRSDSSCQSTVSFNENAVSYSQIVKEKEKPSESNKEEPEISSSITSEKSLITNIGNGGTLVSVQDGEHVEKNEVGGDDLKTQSVEELNIKSKETFKVGFSWRPSTDFFDKRVVDGMTELALTDSSEHGSDGLNLKPSIKKYDQKDSEGVETKGTPVSPHGVCIDEDSPQNELGVKNDGGLTSVSVGSRHWHQIHKSKSRSSQDTIAVVNHEIHEIGSRKHQPDLKNKFASGSHWHASRGRCFRNDSNSGEGEAPSVNDDLSETGASVSQRQLSKDVFLPGEDPIWYSYTSYLPRDKHEVSDSDSTEKGDISDPDESDILDSDQSSDSDQDITSETQRTSKVSSASYYSYKPNNPTWAYQDWYPDFRYQFPTQDFYSWSPSSYQYFCGPPGQYTPKYSHDYSSQLKPSDYYNHMYSGTYANWPNAYYY